MGERILHRENKPRLVCTACDFVFYQNPKVVVATLLESEGRIILVKRATEPRRGTWSYPGGFLELGESLEEGALRETKEETNLDATIGGLLNVYSRPEAGVVVIVFKASVVAGTPAPCQEVDEIGEFLPSEIPWRDLAFPTTEWALQDWLGQATGTVDVSGLC